MRVFQLFMYLAIIWVVTFLVIGYVHGLHGLTACFEREQDFNKALKDPAYNDTIVIFHCPKENITLPQDESNK